MGKRTGAVKQPVSPWKARAKAVRHAAAEERNALYNKLTPEQKLARLDSLGYAAVKERAKIKAGDQVIVCFDVDGTLIDYLGKPRTEVLALLNALVNLKCTVYVWSGGGVQYAEGWHNRLGLPQSVKVIAKGSIKADLAVDDQSVSLGIINFRTNPLDFMESAE